MVGIILSQLVSKEEEIPNTPPRSKRVAVSAATRPPLSADELREHHAIKAIDYAYHSKLAPVPALIHRQAQPSIEGDSSQPRPRTLQRVPTEIIDENSQPPSQAYSNSRLLARNPLERSPHRPRYPAATPGPSNAAAPPSAGQVARPRHVSPYSPLRYTPDVPPENTRLGHKGKGDDPIPMDVDDDVRSITPTPAPRLATPSTSPFPALARITAAVPTPPSTPPVPSKQPLPISRNNSLTKRASLAAGTRSIIKRSSSSHLTGHPPRYHLRKRKPPTTAAPLVASSSQEAKPKTRSRKRSILRGGILKGRSKKKASKS